MIANHASPAVSLRPVQDEDLPILFRQQADPVATEMAGLPGRDWDKFNEHWQRIRADESTIIRVIEYEGRVAGYALSFIMKGHREAGYWLGREFWGMGIATEALRRFLMEYKVRPLYGVTAIHNKASQRVLQKCGFVFYEEKDNEVFFLLEE